jgi:hypothetical protein
MEVEAERWRRSDGGSDGRSDIDMVGLRMGVR